MAAAQEWALAVGAAVLIKLSSSVDDIAWLLPFIAQPQRWTNFRRAAQYVTTMLMVGCVASAIATGGGAAVSAATGANSDWQAERVLGLISGLALALYGTYLFKGWWNDRQEERLARKVAEEQVSAPMGRSEPSRSRVVAPLPAGHGLPAKSVDQVRGFDEVDVEAAPAGVFLSEAPAERADHSRPIARAELAAPAPAASSPDGDTNAPTELTARRLFVVSVLGSLDDLAVQISLLLAGTFTVAQLLVGLVIGSSLVVCFCLFVTLFKPLTALIQLVPLFAIVFAFAIYTLVVVSLFEPDVVALLSPAMPPPAMPPPAVPPSSTGRLLSVVAPPMLLRAPPPSTRDNEARLLGGGLPPTEDLFSIYWTAGALALGSSTDNFAIGASLGIAGLMLKLKFNVLIAAANALGAFVAAAGGLAIGQVADSFGLWIAALLFGYLAWQEGISLWAGEPASPLQKIAAQANGNMAIAVQFAVPMTLNNLAGGIAGGVVGISPWLSGTSAFCASFAMMATGFFVGQRLHSVLRGSQLDVRLFSCSIFGILAYGQVSEKLQAMWEAHVPFRLALPLFPTDSDALAALVLVGDVAMLSMLLASSRGQQFLEGAAMNTYMQLGASEGTSLPVARTVGVGATVSLAIPRNFVQ